jgi:hypothetical protein
LNICRVTGSPNLLTRAKSRNLVSDLPFERPCAGDSSFPLMRLLFVLTLIATGRPLLIGQAPPSRSRWTQVCRSTASLHISHRNTGAVSRTDGLSK